MEEALKGVKDLLPNAILAMLKEDRLFHAILLEDVSSKRRLAAAKFIAASLVCHNREEGLMCGKCPACQRVLKDAYTDISVLNEDSYKKEIIRELRSEAYISPGEGKYKVYIFERVDSLSPECQNLLLKLIEEPPEDTYFILLAENRFSVLRTVLSRVVAVSLKEPDREKCLAELKNVAATEENITPLEAAVFSGYDEAVGEEILTGKAQKDFYTAINVSSCLAAKKEYPFYKAVASAEKKRLTYTRVLELIALAMGREGFKEIYGLNNNSFIKMKTAVESALESSRTNAYISCISVKLIQDCR